MENNSKIKISRKGNKIHIDLLVEAKNVENMFLFFTGSTIRTGI